MIHDFLSWFGWGVDNAFPFAQTWWSTPMGITCSVIFTFSCFIIVMKNSKHHNIVDTVFYSVASIIGICSIFTGLNKQHDPHNLIRTLVVFFTIKTFVNAICLLRGKNETE